MKDIYDEKQIGYFLRALLIAGGVIHGAISSGQIGMPYGYVTCTLRKAFMDVKVPLEHHEDPKILTLIGAENDTPTLYFWQLYSILGEERISTLISNFYQRVFEDTESDFKEVFEALGTLEHHIKGQTNFWLDAMGGGKRYLGGEHRLKRHHDLAKQIMNTKGATRWLKHMKDTLKDPLVDLTDDKRIKVSLVAFVNFFMEKYAEEYQFRIISKL